MKFVIEQKFFRREYEKKKESFAEYKCQSTVAPDANLIKYNVRTEDTL